MSDRGPPLPPLLVFADDWGRHASSCQHLIRRMREQCRVLWVNSIGTRQVRADSFTFRRGLEKLHGWSKGLKQVADQMWVFDVPMLPGLGSQLLRKVNRQLVTWRLKQVLSSLHMEAPVVLTTLPYIPWLIRGLPRQGLVYYNTDDYSHWHGADRESLQQADADMDHTADLILAASRLLQQRHEPSGRSVYFPHGVDFAHFTSVQDRQDVPAELARLRGPRIGYFGLIYEKLNYELLAALAQRFPDASLVMIGKVTYCPSSFTALPNVHFLGQQAYEELPRYLAGLDMLLLPYVDDEMIRQSGPLKLRECLASGKPTVSIDVPDVRSYQPHVRIGTDAESFINQVQQALQEGRQPALIQARQQAVAEDGWDRRAAVLQSHLLSLGSSRRHRLVASPNGHKHLPRVLDLRVVTGKGGGPEKTMLNSPRFLRDSYDMRLAYIRPEHDPEYDMPERARQMGVALVDIPERGPADPRTLWRLAKEIEAYQPDILHAHDYKTNVLALLLARWYRIPVMTTLHGHVTHSPKLDLYYQTDCWTLPRMDYCVAVSEDLFQFLARLKIPLSRRSLIENAIDSQQFRRSVPSADAKRRENIDPRRLVIGAVGRLSAEKGFIELIRAVDQLLNRGRDVELLIIGEGDQRPELQQLIVELKRTDRVRLLGHRRDTRELYEAMDLFALSSLREGLPNVLLEAMSMEVPVVATRIAGVPRLIQDQVNGLLVEPSRIEELSGALDVLLADEGRRIQLAREGRRTIEEKYSFAVRMEKMRCIYDRILKLNSSTPAGTCPSDYPSMASISGRTG